MARAEMQGCCVCVGMNGSPAGKSTANYKDSKQSCADTIRGWQREGRDDTDPQCSRQNESSLTQG